MSLTLNLIGVQLNLLDPNIESNAKKLLVSEF